ncbi:chromate efflux transporter [Pseudomarimonas arenosa]|uniref:Chromate efflux transporter n=1 Tax=Pseudomarimonas arenosa TaxID=2774145 RepID=A0AAW3ZEC8_9GAMM|nr:chromate efflux transporter [Pseudomarimonas arenosa]MBD8524595.1 chromate efflux transporter [Pseudomarimonas arenosa]
MSSASAPSSPQISAPAVRLGEASRFWLKLGLISFGGPAGQIAIMHQELVERRRWISERRFLHALNYCMLLPGPEAQQLATYLGWLMHRVPGGLIAGGLFVLPSLLILCLLSWVYLRFGDQVWVAAAFSGIKPAVVAIVLHACWRIGQRTLTSPLHWGLAGAAFLALAWLNVPFPVVVVAAATIGFLLRSAFSGESGSHGPAEAVTPTKALIDDDTPTPVHARFSLWRATRTCGVALLLWCLPIGLLVQQWDAQHALPGMAWFFTKAALLTFGGAYAVLPYVYQGAVEHHAWLSAAQMIDGLALGETTPGPLIMVVSFVGFVAGHTQAWFGPELAWLSGVLAACVVTWFTFLPSFLFIFLGAPWIESTHGQLRLQAPLKAITAAIVGVILNLACFFAYHTFWPQGFAGTLRYGSVVIAALAFLALWRRRSVIEVIVAAGLSGCLIEWIWP